MRITMDLGVIQSVSPQMIASTAVLQCGAQELSEYLAEMSYENPMMDLREPEQKEPSPAKSILADRFRWLRSSDRQNRSYYAEPNRDSPDQYLSDYRESSLEDFLEEQILILEISPEMRAAMEVVVELLDDRGLFTGTVSEIAALAGCSEAAAAEALRRVRDLEPVGVASENVQQALLRQLEHMEKPVAKRLLRDHFSHLGTWSDQRIARAMGVSEDAVIAAKHLIATLSPHPGNGFSPREQIQYVIPDVSVGLVDGVYQARSEEDAIPTVHINPEYLRMLETEQDPEVQSYLKTKLRQLEQVMGNLDRRKSTVLRCGEVIAARQAVFFRGGVLQKLTLRDVAEELGLHESTISRAVKNKYLSCSRGVFPMSAFFSRDAGQNVGLSRSGIQEIMMGILEGEDPQKPMSDERIAAELEKKRIVLSRRAVAKYRAELGIPIASVRKHRSAV